MINRMFCVLRLVRIVVKLFVLVKIGFEVILKFMFNLCVMICVSVVLFNLGGL